MKQVGSDTYNVAWFKLADCIARGEKERALGIYRLLAHSLDDSALASQLQGDILRSFQDEQAFEKYIHAAELYRTQGRFLEAAAVYEHLSCLDRENVAYRYQMIELYQQLNIRTKVTEYVKELLQWLLKKDDWKKGIEIVMEFETAGDLSFAAALHEQILFYLAVTEGVLPDTILVHAKKAIDAWNEQEDEAAIGKLCTRLEATNEKVAAHAKEYWQSVKK